MKIKAVFILVVFIPAAALAQRTANYNRTFSNLGHETNAEKATQLLEALIAQAREQGEPGREILANLFLGDLMQRTGDFARAEGSLSRAYQLYQQYFETRKSDYLVSKKLSYTYCDAIDRLAYFSLYTGNDKKAEQLFLESQARREATFSSLSIHRVHPVIGLGSVYRQQGKIKQALEQFEHAHKMISRATTTGFDFDQLNRLFYNDMIEICLDQGALTEAHTYIKSLAIGTSGLKKFSTNLISKLETARVFELYARLYVAEGKYDEAQEYLDKANTYYPASVATSDVRFKITKTQAMLYWGRQDWVRADETFVALVRHYRSHISKNFIAMSEYEKEKFYHTLKRDFDLFNNYVAASYARTPSHLFEEMYDNIVNSKALLLNSTNKKKNKILESGDKGLIDKFHDWESARATLSALHYEAGNEVQIASTTKKLEELEKSLNQVSGLFENSENPPDWRKIQATLEPNEVAVELARIPIGKNDAAGKDSSVYLMLVLKHGQSPPSGYLIRGGIELEFRYLNYYRNSILGQIAEGKSYEQFWVPLKKYLAGSRRVYFSPDGVYNQINLNTLFNADTEQYLLDEIELVSLTNTADLLSNREKGQSGPPVLVGRPQFDEVVHRDTTAMAYHRMVLTKDLITFKANEFLDLPGTEKEIRTIEQRLAQQGVHAVSYLGSQATEQNVKSVKSPSILHVATHGFFVDDAASIVSPMIRSGLVLAGVKAQHDSGEDGILTAYEAANLDLQNTNLVVLSACETGLGEVRNGEGVYGLQRAIIVAGADNLLMSLWKVDDAVTAKLMTALYESIQSNKWTAFRNAQIELRKTYPEPYYWGAFIMLGK